MYQDSKGSSLDELVLGVLCVQQLGLGGSMAEVVSLLFITVKDLVLVAHKLDGLLVLVLLDGLCKGSVQDLATVGGDAEGVEAVEDLGGGHGFVARGTAAVFGADGEVVSSSEHVLLARYLGLASDSGGSCGTSLDAAVVVTMIRLSVYCFRLVDTSKHTSRIAF